MSVEPFPDLPETTLPLWRIREFSEVYVDAMVRDDIGQFVFASLFGRDGAIQQLLAAFHLRQSEGGIDSGTLVNASSACPTWANSTRFAVGDPKRLTKMTGKLPRGIFGNLVHVFVYDEAVIDADRSAGSGWVLSFDGTDADHQARIWAVLKELLQVPVLDHWQAPLLAALADQIHHCDRDHRAAFPAIGRVRASQILLNEQVADLISQLVRDRVLTREPSVASAQVANAA